MRQLTCTLLLTWGLMSGWGWVSDPALGQGNQPASEPPSRGTYKFNQPDATYQLSSSLREISGIAVLNDSLLGAVEDESGVLFLLDQRDGSIVDRRPFGEAGDYEGLAAAGPRVFVLSSNGTLTIIEDWRADSLQVRVINTGLPSANDMEGVAFDAARNRLLLACKTCSDEARRRLKHIYGFDLATETLAPEPILSIETKAYMETADEPWINRVIRSIVDPLFDLSGLRPSDLTLHPLTGEVLLLSSGRRSLTVVGLDGEVRDVWTLPSQLFSQPEGLAALPNGDLFISNEGNVSRATLMRFNRYAPERP